MAGRRWAAGGAGGIWRALTPPLLGLLCCSGVAGKRAAAAAPRPEPPHPITRIAVAPLGFHAPGKVYLLLRLSFTTLDFIDDGHLLFTFHQNKLMPREQNPGPIEDDQLIHALVMALPEGRVQAAADWRMHDRGAYLWALSGGRFAVRQRDDYALTDERLQLTPVITAQTHVSATEVSPDGRLLGVENDAERHTPEEHERLMRQAAQGGGGFPAEGALLNVIDPDSRAILARLLLPAPVLLPINREGYVATLRLEQQSKADRWAVTFRPYKAAAPSAAAADGAAGQAGTDQPAGNQPAGNQARAEPEKAASGGASAANTSAGERTAPPQERKLGVLASTCSPREAFVSDRVLLLESCGPNTSDTFLDAWTVDGKALWRARRDAHLVWPTLALSLGGARFALGLLRVSHPIDLASSLDDDAVKEQVVQVFDTDTGTLRMTVAASPIMSAGHNFALSPDGRRLAVLHDGAIEVYDVPDGQP